MAEQNDLPEEIKGLAGVLKQLRAALASSAKQWEAAVSSAGSVLKEFGANLAGSGGGSGAAAALASGEGGGAGQLVGASLAGNLIGGKAGGSGIGGTAGGLIGGAVGGPAGFAAGNVIGGLVEQTIGGAFGLLKKAVTGLADTIQQVITSTKPWVEALDPGLINLTNIAFRNLQATLGYAFTPIFQTMIQAFKQIGGEIFPLMQKLRPIIESLSQSVSGVVLPVIKFLVNQFETMLPILKSFADAVSFLVSIFQVVMAGLQLFGEAILLLPKLLEAAFTPFFEIFRVVQAYFDGFADVLNVLSVIVKTLVQQITEWLDALIKSLGFKTIIDAVSAAFKNLIRGILIFTALLAKGFGFDKFLGDLIENLKPKEGLTASKNYQITNLESINREISLASAQAATPGENKKTDLGDIIKVLEDIRDGKSNNDVITILANIKAGVDMILGAVAKTGEFVANPVGTAFNAALGFFGGGK